MKSFLLDTNIILRFLTSEPTEQAQSAKELFKQSEAGTLTIRILPLVIAEVVFVLTGKYFKMDRLEVADALILFLENPSLIVVDRECLIGGLRIFKLYPIDFADAYLAATAQINGYSIASFDQDFKKIKHLDLYNFQL